MAQRWEHPEFAGPGRRAAARERMFAIGEENAAVREPPAAKGKPTQIRPSPPWAASGPELRSLRVVGRPEVDPRAETAPGDVDVVGSA